MTHTISMEESPDPPFVETYKNLFDTNILNEEHNDLFMVEECELPLINLHQLKYGDKFERQECKKKIAKASREWGFFQVVNHGVSPNILGEMRTEQVTLFKKTFNEKMNIDKSLNFSEGSYRWGTPTATCLRQISWSEAFHVPLSDVSKGFSSLSLIMKHLSLTLEIYFRHGAMVFIEVLNIEL
ncbi:hypothetical protein KY289_006770 [Solanum tuberosum]|nr:hypothetical protein KY289_006770 [Solanum tuberosum]